MKNECKKEVPSDESTRSHTPRHDDDDDFHLPRRRRTDGRRRGRRRTSWLGDWTPHPLRERVAEMQMMDSCYEKVLGTVEH